MEFSALTEAKGKLNAARKSLSDVFDEAGKDLDMARIKSLSGDNTDKLEWIRTKNAEIEALTAEVHKLDEIAGIAAKRSDERASYEEKAGHDNRTERKTVGDLFGESAARKNFRRGMREGAVSELDVDVKALMTTGNFWEPETTRNGVVVDYATRPAPHVVNFIPATSTGQSAIVYMEETTFTNNAFETDEAGAYAQSQIGMTERSEAVRKVATYMSVTDEQLEDEANARSRINQRLPFMISQRVDNAVLNGTGTSVSGGPVQLRGTLNVSGIQTQAQSGADNILDTIHKGFTKIRTVGFSEPSVVFMNPSDWEIVELMKTADGVYLWGAPSTNGPRTTWGVPVVTTPVLTAGTAVTGDYRNYSELAVRRGMDVQITNSHDTDFIHGIQAVRADVRVAMVHYRPTAFCSLTGLAAV